ncbi:hypothetical protein GIB67_007971, partial [Kingdonia uniflora]
MGFMFLYGSHDRKMRQEYITNDDDCLNKSCFNNGDLKLEKMGTDDIIVGAIVAGTAHAHTLGKVDIPSCFVGLILENCELPFPNHGHVLGDPSPILFYPISSTEVRCLVDVPGQRVSSITNDEMANYLKNYGGFPGIYELYVPPQLYDSFIVTIDNGSITIMQNKSMPADPHPIPGALLMGDAFNMRHPLTGGGMTRTPEILLHLGKAAVEEGNVVGGGCTLLRLAAKVDAIKLTLDNDEQKVLHGLPCYHYFWCRSTSNFGIFFYYFFSDSIFVDTFQVGADIVKKVLSYPLKLIAKNVSDSGSVVMEMVFSSDNFKYGYNAATGKYEDLMVVGIINPTK